MNEDPNNFGLFAGIFASAWVGLLQLLHLRTVKRMDKVEEEAKQTVTRPELNAHLDRIHTDMKEGFKEIRGDIRDIHTKIDSQHRG